MYPCGADGATPACMCVGMGALHGPHDAHAAANRALHFCAANLTLSGRFSCRFVARPCGHQHRARNQPCTTRCTCIHSSRPAASGLRACPHIHATPCGLQQPAVLRRAVCLLRACTGRACCGAAARCVRRRRRTNNCALVAAHVGGASADIHHARRERQGWCAHRKFCAVPRF